MDDSRRNACAVSVAPSAIECPRSSRMICMTERARVTGDGPAVGWTSSPSGRLAFQADIPPLGLGMETGEPLVSGSAEVTDLRRGAGSRRAGSPLNGTAGSLSHGPAGDWLAKAHAQHTLSTSGSCVSCPLGPPPRSLQWIPLPAGLCRRCRPCRSTPRQSVSRPAWLASEVA